MKKLIYKIWTFVMECVFYPVIVWRVMRGRKQHLKDKRDAWNLFYSRHKKWLTQWYQEKGLNSKPPVYYDQVQKIWVRLNHNERRKLLKLQRRQKKKLPTNH